MNSIIGNNLNILQSGFDECTKCIYRIKYSEKISFCESEIKSVNKDKNNDGIDKQIDPQKEEKKAALNGNLLFAFAVGFPKKESSERLVYRANMQKIKELTDGIEIDDDEEGEDDDD